MILEKENEKVEEIQNKKITELQMVIHDIETVLNKERSEHESSITKLIEKNEKNMLSIKMEVTLEQGELDMKLMSAEQKIESLKSEMTEHQV